MKHLPRAAVIKLTLLALCFFSGCSSYVKGLRQLYQDPCKNRAYVRLVLEDYLSRRFHSRSPVRVAVVPFSTPANLSADGLLRPGLDNELAWELHAGLLESGRLPMVEVFNRLDWPGKREEFFTGNFGAISLAAEAGYDLVLVGYLDDIRKLDRFTAYAKLIEVESGITIWYGKSTLEAQDPEFQRGEPWWLFGTRRPDNLLLNELPGGLVQCLLDNLLSDKPAP